MSNTTFQTQPAEDSIPHPSTRPTTITIKHEVLRNSRPRPSPLHHQRAGARAAGIKERSTHLHGQLLQVREPQPQVDDPRHGRRRRQYPRHLRRSLGQPQEIPDMRPEPRCRLREQVGGHPDLALRDGGDLQRGHDRCRVVGSHQEQVRPTQVYEQEEDVNMEKSFFVFFTRNVKSLHLFRLPIWKQLVTVSWQIFVLKNEAT